MRNLFCLAAAAVAVSIAAPALAETTFSAGYDGVDLGPDYLQAMVGRVDYSKGALGVEGEVAFGAGSYHSGHGAGRVSESLPAEFGLFGVASHSLNDAVSVFARAGYADIDLKTTHGVGTTHTDSSDTEGGLAYGAGAIVMFSDNNGVRADYSRYDVQFDKTGPTKGANPQIWSLSIVHDFR